MDRTNSPTISPFAQPVYVMAKPAGALCNLACTYCYYTEKTCLHTQDVGRKQVLSDELLERFVQEYIAMQSAPSVLFTWHGGEPLMRPISFYQRALALQQKYAKGRKIDNCIQTNGTLITDEWAKFFYDNNFLVGVSIDGPQVLHDAYRRSRTGRPSWRQVMKGISYLNKYNVAWNAMAVVNRLTAEDPLLFYHFFKDIDCNYLQFTPVVERLYPHHDGRHLASPIDGAMAKLADFSVTPEGWGNFLCTIFDEWVRADVGKTFVQLFDATLAGWMGMQPGVCTLAETCGHAGVIEFNGDVYSCDHFVFPEFKLGNIATQSLSAMMHSEAQHNFGVFKRTGLTLQCRECEFLFACHGECPRNRFVHSVDGEPAHNYLCAGYYRFFKHVAPYMDYMKQQLLHNQPAADVMQWAKQNDNLAHIDANQYK